jgi:hypothetical protein
MDCRALLNPGHLPGIKTPTDADKYRRRVSVSQFQIRHAVHILAGVDALQAHDPSRREMQRLGQLPRHFVRRPPVSAGFEKDDQGFARGICAAALLTLLLNRVQDKRLGIPGLIRPKVSAR